VGGLHCADGPVAWMVYLMEEAEQWDETVTPPHTLVAGFAEGGGARPLFSYPSRAAYIRGYVRNLSSFECR